MNFKTGRPDHIEDYLINLHTGGWFGWSDSKNKIYANLIIHDDSKDKPTEQACTDGLAQMQSAFDALAYVRARETAYPQLKEFAEAYCEKEIGEDSTKWDAYVTKYNLVRSNNPKP